jgi:threonine/homoserine/homoserine lactone efflux protein
MNVVRAGTRHRIAGHVVDGDHVLVVFGVLVTLVGDLDESGGIDVDGKLFGLCAFLCRLGRSTIAVVAATNVLMIISSQKKCMFGVGVLIAFVPVAIALIISPGPDSIYTLTRSVSDGQLSGVMAALGSSTGSIVHTTAAVLGLSAILRTSALAYSIVKFVGAAYLLYLGVQIFRNIEEFDITPESTSYTPRESFRSALMINVLNPKVAIFFLAFLPQFVQPGSDTTLQIFTLGVLFASLGFLYQALLAVFSARARKAITERELVQSMLRTVSGSVLVGFGVKLALERRTTP